MKTIRNLAKKYLDVALEYVSDYGSFQPTKESWEDFVDIVFTEYFETGFLPGYENPDIAMACVSINRDEAVKPFDALTGNMRNPFRNPCEFLVHCVAFTASRLWTDYRNQWIEMWSMQEGFM